MSYCRFANSLPAGSSDPNKHYHDHVYGFAVADDKELFERLVLEINQAGLSWTLILRKQHAFQAAYRGVKPLSGSLSPRYRLLKTAHILLAA